MNEHRHKSVTEAALCSKIFRIALLRADMYRDRKVLDLAPLKRQLLSSCSQSQGGETATRTVNLRDNAPSDFLDRE